MRSQQGFSLMELLAALVILTIVIMTTLAVFSERRNRLNQASELILAYQVLANEAELERRIPFDEVMPMSGFTSSTDLIKPLQPYTAKIDVASPKGGVKDVTLSLTWHKGERNAKLIIERVDTGGGNLW
jgi:prepilin-type N-terminal cleavage/methylation domain-containing protein